MNAASEDYGLWSLVAINSAFFILFAASFFKPRTRQDWRTLGMFSAFVVALFTEMYGFPLTIYLLSGWMAERFPRINWMSHNAGHLPEMLFGWKANPHFGPFHLLSTVFIIGGFLLLAKAWPVLYNAQKTGRIASTGPYARIRHPQYAAFILVMAGFLLQWPTVITLILFPILVAIYVRLARREEVQAIVAFGEDYRIYMTKTPGWWPHFMGDSAQHRRAGSILWRLSRIGRSCPNSMTIRSFTKLTVDTISLSVPQTGQGYFAT